MDDAGYLGFSGKMPDNEIRNGSEWKLEYLRV